MSGPVSKDEPRITMERWLNTYLVASTNSSHHAAVQDVIRRIDHEIVENLPLCCGRSLSYRLGDARAEVWRIRNLDLSFVVDISAPAAVHVAQSWGDHVAASIQKILDDGAEGGDILCFPDRAAYLAQYAIDRAAGRARGKWYYEEFRSLDVLAAGRAISELLVEEPEWGAQTVLHLAESGRLEEILLVLTESDAHAILRQCFSSGESGASAKDLSQWSGRLLEIWNEGPVRQYVHASAADALRWLARANLRFPGAAQDPAACAAVDGLLELQRVLSAMSSAVAADRLVRALAGESICLEEAVRMALKEGAESPENGLRFLARIATGDPDWASQAIAVLMKDQLPGPPVQLAYESMITPFGGVFLLGPALIELAIEDKEEAGLLRHIALAKCMGIARAAEAMADTALRLFAGDYKTRWPAGCDAIPQPIPAGNIVRMTGCEGRCLVAETIRLPWQEKEILLLRDFERDVWIYASVLPKEQALNLGVDLVREATGNVPQVSSSEPVTDHELSYFLFGSVWPDFNIDLDLSSALCARAVLKGFARRLMGFQASSPEHLYRNFLAGVGTVRNLSERIEVELPRVPLLLVLQISGQLTQTYSVPWLEGKEICLAPPRE
jgi:hypothetical protein